MNHNSTPTVFRRKAVRLGGIDVTSTIGPAPFDALAAFREGQNLVTGNASPKIDMLTVGLAVGGIGLLSLLLISVARSGR